MDGKNSMKEVRAVFNEESVRYAMNKILAKSRLDVQHEEPYQKLSVKLKNI